MWQKLNESAPLITWVLFLGLIFGIPLIGSIHRW